MSGFSNPIVGGVGTLVRTFIKSFNYVAGVAGWIIQKNGHAEFNDITVRGTVDVIGADGSEIAIQALSGFAAITLYPSPGQPVFQPGVIDALVGSAFNAGELLLQSPAQTGVGGFLSTLTLRSDDSVGGGPNSAQIELGAPGAGAVINLNVGLGQVNIDGIVAGNGPLFIIRGAGANTCFNANITGDSAGRWIARADGHLLWGPGNAATDATLYRHAAGSALVADDIRWNNGGAGETFHTLTYQNGWTDFGGAFQTGKYKRVAAPNNSILLVGVIAPGTKVDGTIVANLPVGYRPATNTVRFPVAQDGTVATNQRMDLDTAGNLKIQGVNLAGLAAVSFSVVIPLDG